jgi:hypothetical protein
MPQLSIDDSPAIGYAGQLAEPGAPVYRRSAIAEGSTLTAGAAVIRGTVPEMENLQLEIKLRKILLFPDFIL